MRRVLLSLIVLMASMSGTVVRAAGQPVQKVIGGSPQQFWASSDGTFVAYARAMRNKQDAMLRNLATGHDLRINPAGTYGTMGSFIAGTSKVIYQQVAGKHSDLYFFDVNTHSRSKAPAKVDTPNWEYWPLGSANFLLFGRSLLKHDGTPKQDTLVVYDRVADRQHVLIPKIRKGHSVYPGYAGTRYVAWTDCTPANCRLRYWDATNGTTHGLPLAGGMSSYAPSFDELAGKMYFVQAKSRQCGHQVTIRRVSIGSSSSTEIAKLPAGMDVGWTTSLAPNLSSSYQDLYFEHWNCKARQADVYAVRSVDAV